MGWCLSCPHFLGRNEGKACVFSAPRALGLTSEVLAHSWPWPRCPAVSPSELLRQTWGQTRGLGLGVGAYSHLKSFPARPGGAGTQAGW